ncbi:MAG: hypothetical protein WD397_17385 [Wenzhouxiangellaceae bacterium]
MAARHWRAAMLMLTAAVAGATPATDQCGHVLVDTATMREVIAGIEGYDTAAATNQSRFVADFLFGLARRPEITGRSGTFQVQPERFFEAWLEVTEHRADEAPVSMRKVLEHGQRFVVDARAAVRISPASVEARQALAVRASWPDAPGTADHYSYHDTMAEPSIRLRHERVITYLLIDFGDFVAYENMRGIRGRPTSGALGALFGLLGMAEILQSRFAVADDQSQVNRSRVEKLFSFTTLTTITPDGIAERGIPADRDDLERLADKLERPLDIEMLRPWPAACE